jgi:hypothetical protein
LALWTVNLDGWGSVELLFFFANYRHKLFGVVFYYFAVEGYWFGFVFFVTAFSAGHHYHYLVA